MGKGSLRIIGEITVFVGFPVEFASDRKASRRKSKTEELFREGEHQLYALYGAALEVSGERWTSGPPFAEQLLQKIKNVEEVYERKDVARFLNSVNKDIESILGESA